MSEVASPALDDAVLGSEVVSQHEPPQGQHEAVETAVNVVSARDSVPDDELGFEPSQDQPIEPPHASVDAEPAAHISHGRKPASTKPKSTMSGKPLPSKSNGGSSAPIVKKIIDSGTFGTGSVKPAVVKPTTAKAPAAPVIKKSTSASPAPSKPTMAPQPPPNRRLSVAPAKPAATSAAKPALSSSTSSKPVPSATATRMSVVSPSGSATSSASRPRASVTEGLKRAPTRPATTASKPPVTSKSPPVRSSTVAPSRTNLSISSIHEVKEDGTSSGDLQNKLKGVTESLAVKAEAIAKLEGQVSELSTSLETATIAIASKTASVEQLELEKSLLEKELERVQQSLVDREAKQEDEAASLKSLQEELQAVKVALTTQLKLVEDLRAQLRTMEGQASASQESLEALRASTSSDANIASAEHEELLTAREDLKTITAERDTLKLTHAQALNETRIKYEALETKVTMVDDLLIQVDNLKIEKEENAGKLSELEVEILELKEALEKFEYERDASLGTISSLEKQLVVASSATQQASEETKIQAADFAAQIDNIRNLHKEQLEVASEDRAKVVSSLETLKVELASVIAAKDLLKTEALAAEDANARKLEESAQLHAAEKAELLEEIRSITATLQGQEALYDSKVNAVKDQHNQLLQEAFERAKHEAGAEHTLELQALRASSAATTEQIQVMNQAAVDDLKAEHAATLDSEVARLENTINGLKLDLKATQDDLAKAKSGLELSRAEVENLRSQRDEARASSLSSTDGAAAQEEAIRLAQELANTKDDLAAVTEHLDLTKASLTELSNNHSRESEEAARSRAEEVQKMQNSHTEAIKALAIEKSELSIKLSDLEGELSTLKAKVAAEAGPAKSNGNGAAPPSPGVTKEELQRMYEAHNLKIHDLEAEHQKIVKVLRDELQASNSKVGELQEEVARKAMEVGYYEQEQDEHQEQITRLREDIKSLTERRNTDGPPP